MDLAGGYGILQADLWLSRKEHFWDLSWLPMGCGSVFLVFPGAPGPGETHQAVGEVLVQESGGQGVK